MKMIQGGKGLAAALGGAETFKYERGVWRKASAKTWRKLHDASSPRARVYGVRAADARRVLG